MHNVGLAYSHLSLLSFLFSPLLHFSIVIASLKLSDQSLLIVRLSLHSENQASTPDEVALKLKVNFYKFSCHCLAIHFKFKDKFLRLEV